MPEIAALRSFVTVVDSGSIAEAARGLGYSSAAVSRHIAAVEAEVGLVLFRRTGKSIHASTGARILADKARLLLEEADQFGAAARSLARGEEGVIRLAYFRAAGTTIVPPALAILAEQRPGVRVVLHECALTEEVRDLLDTGEADVGILWGFLEPDVRDLETIAVYQEALVLLTSIDRDDLHEDPRDLTRLVDEPFAMAPGHLGSPPLVDAMFLRAGLPTPTVTHRPYDHALQRSLIAAGLVVSMTPALGVADEFRGVRRSIVTDDFRRTYLAFRPGSRDPLVRAMVDALLRAASDFRGFGLTYLGDSDRRRGRDYATRLTLAS